MDLPLKQQVFDFEYTTELGKKYEGQFTVLCSLNMSQRHALEIEKTRLLGNYQNPTDALAGIAILLSNLRVKIIDGPPWWTQSNGGGNLEEEELVVILYNKVQEVEDKWKEDLKKKAQKAKEEGQLSKNNPATSS